MLPDTLHGGRVTGVTTSPTRDVAGCLTVSSEYTRGKVIGV